MNKLIKIILYPFSLLFGWSFYLASFAAGILRYFYIQNPTAKFSFAGKAANVFWHLSPIILVGFMLILIINTWNYVQNRKAFKNKFSIYVVGFSSIFTFLLANYLSNLELSKYGNYLYSTYGITKSSVYWLSNVSLIIIILFGTPILMKSFGQKYWMFLEKNGGSKFIRTLKPTRKNLIAALTLLILAWYSLSSFMQVGGYLSYAKSSYEHQFENYREITALKDFTDESAKIVLPPQSSKYPAISNPPIVRYFLFPRTLISSSYIIDQKTAINLEKVYFITINKNGNISWPVIDESQKQITFKEGVNLKYSTLKVFKETGGAVIYEVKFYK